MNILKRTMLAGVAILAFSGFGKVAWAGGGDYSGATAPKGEIKECDKYKKLDPKARFEEFSKKLNLTAEQQEKIRPIKEDKEKAIKELYKETWDKKMKIMDDTHAKIKAFLTPEQQKKFEEMIAKCKAECKKHHHEYEMMHEGYEHPEHPAGDYK